MKHLLQKLIRCGCSSAMIMLLAGTSLADMPVTFLEVDAVPGAYYGWGYNMGTQQFTSPCVECNTSKTYPSGEPDEGSAYEFAENTAIIASKSNLTVKAALKALTSGGIVKANNKTKVAGDTESCTYNQSLFANAFRYDKANFLDLEDVNFKEGPRNLLTTPGGKGQFKQQCGDGFVIGVRMGREFIGTATVINQTLKSSIAFSSETGAGGTGPWGTANASGNIGKVMEQLFGNNNISVKTYSTGSNQPKPTQASEFQEYYKNFLNSVGDKAMVQLVVAPYNLVKDYPWENPLEGSTKEDYIGMMVVALWELKAAIVDASYVLNPITQSMFALGLNKSTKNTRIDYIKNQRNAWLKEYDMLLNAAQKCDKRFTDNCQQLAEYYDRHRNLAAQWYAIMPERYLSDCYQQRSFDPAEKMCTALVQQSFGSPAHGDSEEGGNPCRVVAKLKLQQDLRQLKAKLAVAKIEWNRKEWRNQRLEVRRDVGGESGWGLAAQTTIFDLDIPQLYGLGQENLKYCTWLNAGYQRRDLVTPSAAEYFERFGLDSRNSQGYIDGITGKHARGQQMFTNGKGYLDFITCEVDRRGDDNNMKCLSLGMKRIPLSLCSTQDLLAGSWKSPVVPRIPTVLTNFSSNKALELDKNDNQFNVFTQMVSVSKLIAADFKKTEASNRFKAVRYQLPLKQKLLIIKRLKPNDKVREQMVKDLDQKIKELEQNNKALKQFQPKKYEGPKQFQLEQEIKKREKRIRELEHDNKELEQFQPKKHEGLKQLRTQ